MFVSPWDFHGSLQANFESTLALRSRTSEGPQKDLRRTSEGPQKDLVFYSKKLGRYLRKKDFLERKVILFFYCKRVSWENPRSFWGPSEVFLRSFWGPSEVLLSPFKGQEISGSFRISLRFHADDRIIHREIYGFKTEETIRTSLSQRGAKVSSVLIKCLGLVLVCSSFVVGLCSQIS